MVGFWIFLEDGVNRTIGGLDVGHKGKKNCG